MKKYLKNKSFLTGLILVIILTGLLAVSMVYIPFDTEEMNVTDKFALPDWVHLLGTDQFGRDTFSRMLKGLQNSFFIGTITVITGGTVGILIGSFAGYFGGKADEILMKLIDAQMAFPGVLLALMLIAVFGNGIQNTILALAIMSVPKFVRISRSGFMRLRDSDFVKAEKVRGASLLRIMFLHILPNITSELAATASLAFAGAVMSEAGLSYLGLGIVPPTPSLGGMLSEAQVFLLKAPWYVVIPAAVITILVMGFNLLGDGIQEVNQQ